MAERSAGAPYRSHKSYASSALEEREKTSAAQAASSDTPARTISRVNLALYRRGIESRFVTLMYGSLAADGRLTYTNAGHNPPLLRTAYERAVFLGRELTGQECEPAAAVGALVQLVELDQGGVDVEGFAESSAEGRLVHSPDHPLADEEGYVRMPDLDMSSQMSQLVMAQRGYQASVQVTKTAQDTYTAALQIGNR